MKTSLSCYNPAVYHILYKTVKLSIGLHESLLYVIVSVSYMQKVHSPLSWWKWLNNCRQLLMVSTVKSLQKSQCSQLFFLYKGRTFPAVERQKQRIYKVIDCVNVNPRIKLTGTNKLRIAGRSCIFNVTFQVQVIITTVGGLTSCRQVYWTW